MRPDSSDRRRRLAACSATLILLISRAQWPASADEFSLDDRAHTAIAVRGGATSFDLPAGREASRTLVVVSCLGRGAGPFPIRLEARSIAAENARPIEAAKPAAHRSPRLAHESLPAPAPPATHAPAAQRVFHLLVRDGDPASAGNYVAVHARLRAIGSRVQVYVDEADAGHAKTELINDLVKTFDESVFPVSARRLGQARDVDGDGRFTILISGWLSRLAGGRLAVDGFVRGADFDPSLKAPLSNHCDMMYVNANLEPGPYLRTILAHEYTHAVTTSVRPPGQEEEGWLDEALAHLAEDLHGFSRSNLDYRISAFLSCPERYRLVVDDYYAANLFRSHGNRGSTYLFLRWCADRYGADLLPALMRSELRGIESLEQATGCSFADLYRAWSIALFFQTREQVTPDGWLLIGPRPAIVRPDEPAGTWMSQGTASHYVVVETPAGKASRITISAPEEAGLQVTSIALPRHRPRVEMNAAVLGGGSDECRLRIGLRERGGEPVRIVGVSFEPLVPPANHKPGEHARFTLNQDEIDRVLGSRTLAPNGRLATSTFSLKLPDAHGPWILKLLGRDENGRPVTAWAPIDTPSRMAVDSSDEP